MGSLAVAHGLISGIFHVMAPLLVLYCNRAAIGMMTELSEKAETGVGGTVGLVMANEWSLHGIPERILS